MKKIFKHQMPIDGIVNIRIPADAELLTIDASIPYRYDGQGRPLVSLYFLADPAQEHTREQQFRIIGTSHEFNDHADWQYWRTAFQDKFVWHVFVPKSNEK